MQSFFGWYFRPVIGWLRPILQHGLVLPVFLEYFLTPLCCSEKTWDHLVAAHNAVFCLCSATLTDSALDRITGETASHTWVTWFTWVNWVTRCLGHIQREAEDPLWQSSKAQHLHPDQGYQALLQGWPRWSPVICGAIPDQREEPQDSDLCQGQGFPAQYDM